MQKLEKMCSQSFPDMPGEIVEKEKENEESKRLITRKRRDMIEENGELKLRAERANKGFPLCS